jgi:hypothetical protein
VPAAERAPDKLERRTIGRNQRHRAHFVTYQASFDTSRSQPRRPPAIHQPDR